jgi:large subunit ribosomal protein L1
MANEKILSAIKELREKQSKRNFSQTLDLVISLKEFDVKKAENRISEDIFLPHGRGSDASIVVFSETTEDLDCKVLGNEDIATLAKNKRAAKKLGKEVDFFLAEPKLMPAIGRALGPYLSPRGKMPKLITSDLKKMVKEYKKSVRAKMKDAPVIQCLVGKENMKDDELAENVETILKHLETKLPKGKHNFGKILLKFTMSKPVGLVI